MKAILRKYVSLVIMLSLLVLVVSLLPAEGTVEASYGYKASADSVQAMSLSSRELSR